MKIKVDIKTAAIMKGRGLGGDNRAQVFLATQVKKFSDPYVPMQRGILKNTAVVASDGSTLTYVQPYAHYQYYGQVMAGRAPKHYTGEALSYSGGGLRGPNWDKRMVIDRGDDLAQSLAKYVGGKAK